MWLWLTRAKTQNFVDFITIADVDADVDVDVDADVDVDVEESVNGRLATA